MPLIKICGIRNEADRDMCLREGCDLIGFNVYEGSKRYVDPEMLKTLIAPRVRKCSVLVGVNNDFDVWSCIIKDYMPGYIQMHGDEDAGIIKRLKKSFPEINVIKKVNIVQIDMFNEIMEIADYILCDTETKGYGGSGRRFNWEKLGDLSREVRNKLFVAGGIDPDNVEEVLRYGIFCVDVATGGEISPGKKDPHKIKSLIEKVRNYGK